MPGSGLGLSIVRQVAERHAGTVRADRSADDGAAFWFTVPGAPVPPEPDTVIGHRGARVTARVPRDFAAAQPSLSSG